LRRKAADERERRLDAVLFTRDAEKASQFLHTTMEWHPIVTLTLYLFFT
jgi:hypothetical protein